MTAFQIRDANVSDAAAIAAVHVAAWRETYVGLLPAEMLADLSVEARTAMWREILTAPATAGAAGVYVAEAAGHIVGFGACGLQRDKALAESGFGAEIGAIYLLRSHQRLGLGRALMKKMALTLKNLDFQGMALWVLRENTAARGFYQHLGGRLVGEKAHARPNAILNEVAFGWRDLALLGH